MKRLTAERVNGIKTGYWSASKKEELVQRLGKYEDTGMEPEKLRKARKWIPVEERLPETGEHVIVSFKSDVFLPGVAIVAENGRWLILQGAEGFNDVTDDVIAWMPLPDPYRPEEGRKRVNERDTF